MDSQMMTLDGRKARVTRECPTDRSDILKALPVVYENSDCGTVINTTDYAM